MRLRLQAVQAFPPMPLVVSAGGILALLALQDGFRLPAFAQDGPRPAGSPGLQVGDPGSGGEGLRSDSLDSVGGRAQPKTPSSKKISSLIKALEYPGLKYEEMQDLLLKLGLDWPLTPDTGYRRMRDAVVGVSSPRGDYCLMVSAKGSFGEMGGPARYCLLDSTGKILWRREEEDFLLGRPAVSASGMSALLVRGEPDGDLPFLLVHFMSPEGKITGSTAWGDRVRPYRGDVHGFSPDGRFLISVKQSDGDTAQIASTRLYSVQPDGAIGWRRDLGPFDAGELLFSKDGDRIVVTDLWMSGPNQVYILDSSGRDISHHTFTGRRKPSGTCLDVDSGTLYFDAGGDLCAIDVTTGRMERSVSTEPLISLAARTDSRAVRDAANRLIKRFRK